MRNETDRSRRRGDLPRADRRKREDCMTNYLLLPAQRAARRGVRIADCRRPDDRATAGSCSGAVRSARHEPDRQVESGREQAGHRSAAAPDAADAESSGPAADRQDQAAGRLQGRGLVDRPSRRAHHGDGTQGHAVHGHATDRARLCHHQQGRQARGQGSVAGPDPAQRARLQGRRTLRARHQQGASLRQYRGQARQSRTSRSS